MSWTLIAAGAVFVLAPSVAVLLGWRPRLLRHGQAPVRLLGVAGLCMYGAVLIDESARLSGPSQEVVRVCAYVALGLVFCSVALVILFDFLGSSSRSRRS
ncbi:hypothetical protein ACFY9F_37200 [Streptomyces sp. NPDC012421]|uniref:hypothetical protein n=1 Tax=Streptomyces sp. NPDC012421 TaxID=3364832 RepID=UPI0036E04D05